MTAKSRRHKFDKRKKSDEHPHPRRIQEDARREACKRDHPAGGQREIASLNVIDPKDYHGFVGVPDGVRLYLTDAEKEVLDEDQRKWEERLGKEAGFVSRGLGDHGELTAQDLAEEAVRIEGASDAEAFGPTRWTDSAEDIVGAIREAKERYRKPGSAYGTPEGPDY